MKVLVPIDILQPADATIEHLKQLVELKDAEVTFLYIREELPAYEIMLETSANFSDDHNKQIEAKAKESLTSAANLLNGSCLKVGYEIVVGAPAMMIDAVAKDEKFDLTVMTPGRRTSVEKFFLGSVCDGVVKHCPGTILISREIRKQHDKLENVVMGVDGSEQSINAIKLAVKQFKLKQAAITLVHVVTVADALKLVSPIEYMSMVESNLLMQGETFLAEGKKLLSDLGVKNVTCKLVEGDPATNIIATSNTLDADLIVIGAQGRTAVQHFLLGSVSHRIAMGAECSTAVVKPAAK